MHIDVWGPFASVTVEGFKYFLNIVDDCSRYTWIYLMQEKSDVLHLFPEFYAIIQNQFQTSIKEVQSDNAPDLFFTDFFKTKGIFSYHSYIDRPQQNSVVEMKHQHLLNVAKALLFQSNVPISYWGIVFKLLLT